MTGLRNFVFGNYVARTSPVHRLDPRAKLLFVILVSLALFAGSGWADLLLWSAVLLVAVPAAQLSAGLLWRGMRAFFWFIGLAFVLQFFLLQPPGHAFWELTLPEVLRWKLERSLFFSGRLLLFIAYSSLLTAVTAPMELADGLERALRPLRRLRVPVHEFSLMTSIAIRFVPTIAAEAERISKAQMARGVNPGRRLTERIRSLLPLVVPLFVATFHRAEELALAMEARGYDSRAERTAFVRLCWGARETALMLAAVVLVLATRMLS